MVKIERKVKRKKREATGINEVEVKIMESEIKINLKSEGNIVKIKDKIEIHLLIT